MRRPIKPCPFFGGGELHIEIPQPWLALAFQPCTLTIFASSCRVVDAKAVSCILIARSREVGDDIASLIQWRSIVFAYVETRSNRGAESLERKGFLVATHHLIEIDQTGGHACHAVEYLVSVT
jgi:hypothetical protein